MKKYDIKVVENQEKSIWKKKVKEKISKKVEEEMRIQCNEMKKTRTVKDDKFEMKKYLKETSLSEAADILKTRLHMVRLPCNYGEGANGCPLCGQEGYMETEHYFGDCQMTKRMAEVWETKPEDLKEDSVDKLKNAKNHLNKVEVLMERHK